MNLNVFLKIKGFFEKNFFNNDAIDNDNDTIIKLKTKHDFKW